MMLARFAVIAAALAMALSCSQNEVETPDDEQGESSDDQVEGDEELDAEGSKSWLMTSTVGGEGFSQEQVRRIPDTVATRLAKQGGAYDHVIDMDDKSGRPVPTKAALLGAFADLAKEISEFEAQQPSTQSNVFIVLGGHGFATDGSYKMQLAPEGNQSPEDAFISGEELVEAITSVKADKLVVMFQSCRSGAIEKAIRDLGFEGNITIVTPVSEHIESNLVWMDVQAEAFTGADADLSKDGKVTMGELRQRLKARACNHPSFVPSAPFEAPAGSYYPLPFEGIDMQVFSRGETDDMVLYTVDSDPAAGDFPQPDDVEAFCEEKTERFSLGFDKSVSLVSFMEKFKDETPIERKSWLFGLRERLAANGDAAPEDARRAIARLILADAKADTEDKQWVAAALSVAAEALYELPTTDDSELEAARAVAKEHLADAKQLPAMMAHQSYSLERLLPELAVEMFMKGLKSGQPKTMLLIVKKLDRSLATLPFSTEQKTKIKETLTNALSKVKNPEAKVLIENVLETL